MVNHLLETSHPLSSVLRLRASARQPIFHPPYTLPSSVSRNPFVCRSYENTGGCGGILPKLEPLSRPQASTPLRAIIDFVASASPKKASRE